VVRRDVLLSVSVRGATATLTTLLLHGVLQAGAHALKNDASRTYMPVRLTYTLPTWNLCGMALA